MNKNICPTFSFIFFSVEKIIVFDKVKKFKILVQKNVFFVKFIFINIFFTEI